MTTTGDRIRAARLYRSMSAEELAHKVGYATQSGIANLENRATGRGGYKLSQIAQVLNVSLEWLLNGDDPLEPSQAPPFTTNTISSSHCVNEKIQPWGTAVGWPFKHISPAHWQRLTLTEREIVERQILGLINSCSSVHKSFDT